MNQHRGSDFNEFLAQENLMTPTPRTDAIAHRGLDSVAYIAEMTDFARWLERELAAERALADRLAGLLENCRDDSCELLGERGWWKDEPRCDYSKRYDETAENIAMADEALAAWKEARRGTV